MRRVSHIQTLVTQNKSRAECRVMKLNYYKVKETVIWFKKSTYYMIEGIFTLEHATK